jgi:hypothetical protein
MNLSEQQKQAIREWVASGASLSDVQRNLKSELGIAMTYIDVRLLVLDLGAAVKDKPEAKPIRTAPPPQPRHEEAGPTVDLDEEMAADNEEMPLDEALRGLKIKEAGLKKAFEEIQKSFVEWKTQHASQIPNPESDPTIKAWLADKQKMIAALPGLAF